MYPLSGFRFVFATSMLLSMVAWLSVVRTIYTNSSISDNNNSSANCLDTAKQLQQAGQQRTTSSLQEWKEESKMLLGAGVGKEHNNLGDVQSPPHTRRLRVLMGIFTLDKHLQLPYRRQYRMLFKVFKEHNDTRVCSLHEFETAPNDTIRYQCQFIYTFVIGGLKRKNAPTELVDKTTTSTSTGTANFPDPEEMLMPKKDFIMASDLKADSTDATFLNIRENMNDGKSQTWFQYASRIMHKYDLDYAGKIDSDSLPYLDKFFQYAYHNLPPPPYNSGILIGVPIDKLWWSKTKSAFQHDKAEQHFKKAYGKVMHLYAAGQCYILSRDLCDTVVVEAPKSKMYREGHEDHDISAMAFRHKRPISFHFLSLQQQFWKHPVKRYKKKVRKWRTLWHNEHLRMAKVLERRQELIRKEAAKAAAAEVAVDEEENTPDQLAAPVQMALDEDEEEGEEEEEEEEGGNSDIGEEEGAAAASA